MAETRTLVWIHAQNGISDDEARHVLGELSGKPFGPVEVWRSDEHGEPRTVFVSLEGDVRLAVEERLAGLSELPFTVDVMTRDER